jgi:type III pantothenate kinase
MFIAIDIGNSSTVIGIYDKDKLVFSKRLSSTIQYSEQDLKVQLQSLTKETGISIKSVEGVGISSVVPKLTNPYTELSRIFFLQEPLIISTALDLGIRINYENLNFLGVDRLCSAVAGYNKYGGPLIIIDFGTATTYNIIGPNGDYLGGVIAPGIETSAVDLYRRTERLPKVDLSFPDRLICTNTTDSIQAGILWSAVYAAEGMIKHIRNEQNNFKDKKASVIATGGFSKFIAEHLKLIEYVEPFLVLDGIRLIYNRVNQKK